LRRFSLGLGLVFSFSVACSSAGLTSAANTSSPGGDPENPTGDGTADADGGTSPSGDGGTASGRSSVDLETSTGVTIQVEPSDKGAALLAAISGAKKSVHMTMYLLTNDKIITALGNLKKAGKEVKVVLNKTFPPNGGDNQPAFDALTTAKVQVVWAPSSYDYTHAKTIVIDGSSAIIMTMNATETSPTTNREYIATDTDPDDVAQLEKVFAADFANQAVHLPSKLVISPTDANTLYSPREQIVGLIDSAKTSLDFEIQSLSDSGVVDAIVRAQKAGVAVRLVIDGETVNTDGQDAAIAKLKAGGVSVHAYKGLDIHAKAIVVDGTRTFVGSQNMTPTALDHNREVGVLTDSKTEAKKVSDVIAGDYAKAPAL
jgi:phosphatidylserine/phosphatidylglycerophosphate/cardiolipin synthase-like enzyme